MIGSARSELFRQREGLRLAARTLVTAGIDRLVAIGGDGSLAGADELSELWPGLLAELVEAGEIEQELADRHPTLWIVGIVGSIDNDMVGTDMTVGADSALHRIVEAIDALEATADSHRRTFVVEIMGRKCGYLALTAALAGGADWAFIPEAAPPDGWEQAMCDALVQGRALGRRHRVVLVAEGAHDRAGERITVERVRRALEERLHEEARVTLLGHVQRGGAPSAFDRSMATMMGYAATHGLLVDAPVERSQFVGLRRNRVRLAPLMRHVRGHRMLGVEGGFSGLVAGRVSGLAVTDVEGWADLGGAELGSRRGDIADHQLAALPRAVAEHRIDGLVLVGGFDAYASAHRIHEARRAADSAGVPVVVLPATIDNSVPGTEHCIGSDTALNAIVRAVDSIKQSAMAARRCFVIETMGRRCGYLALMSAMASGAEQFYLPEEGITLARLAADVERMVARFEAGRRLFLVVRSEGADDEYTTDVVARVFEAEGGDLFDVRAIVLAHVQQGGNPTPFDRVLAARLAAHGIDHLDRVLADGGSGIGVVGLERGQVHATDVGDLAALTDWENRRPLTQWWQGLARVTRDVAGSR